MNYFEIHNKIKEKINMLKNLNYPELKESFLIEENYLFNVSINLLILDNIINYEQFKALFILNNS